MTSTELDAMKAAFLAKGGKVTTASEGTAYGIDAETDKAKRAAERAQREAEESEARHDRQREAAHDAFFTGDREGGYALMTSYERTRSGQYRHVRFERF